MGATGRFGNGDVQWMTAGKGVQHSEMFPLLDPDEDNPFELFQIWLNLPRAKKMVPAYYKMLWSEEMTRFKVKDADDGESELLLVAGDYNGRKALDPTPGFLGI